MLMEFYRILMRIGVNVLEDIIRQATVNDSNDILDIYSYYIENTSVSFETETPTVIDFSSRIYLIINTYPYLVYLRNDKIVGYAYASRHRERAAYQYDVDVSVYIKNSLHSQGIGTALYNNLFEILKFKKYYNAYAGITLPNEKSIALHYKFGFKEIGVHHNTGYKFNKWHDVIWFEKQLKDYSILEEVSNDKSIFYTSRRIR